MSHAAVVRVRSLTSATITQANLLGANPSRFYHLVAPQNVKRPYAIYGIDDGNPAHHLLGAGGLWSGTVGIDIYSDRLTDLETIVEEIRLECDSFRGDVVVDSTTYYVRRLHLATQSEDVQYLDPAKPLPTFHASMGFALDVYQTIPTH